jgi:hypothetical protein
MADKGKKSDKKEKGIGRSAKDMGYKFDINDFAKQLGVKDPAAARQRLRTRGIEKTKDGVYGWNNQKDLDAVVKKCKEGAKSAPKKEEPKKAAPKKDNGKKAAPKEQPPVEDDDEFDDEEAENGAPENRPTV